MTRTPIREVHTAAGNAARGARLRPGTAAPLREAKPSAPPKMPTVSVSEALGLTIAPLPEGREAIDAEAVKAWDLEAVRHASPFWRR